MATVISSQDSTVPSKAEWCFECYRGLSAGNRVKEAKFRIVCESCAGSLYLCEEHAVNVNCPGCGPGTFLRRVPASNISPSTATTGDVAFGLLRDAKIEGLETWLSSLSLSKYLPAAILWCHEEGASSLEEVIKNWEQLANDLLLKPLERKRMSEHPSCQARTQQTSGFRAAYVGEPSDDMSVIGEDCEWQSDQLEEGHLHFDEGSDGWDHDFERYSGPYSGDDIEPEDCE